tara:strand:- start:108 stop:629 length:522 start_codon:yes stop_codon:yes gene_type:complete
VADPKNKFKIVKFESAIYLKQTTLNNKFISSLESVKLKQYPLNENNFFDKYFKDKNKTSLILEFIQPHINEIINQKFKLNNWWIQRYKKENYHDLHTHGHEHNKLSFIVYLKTTPKSSNTIFYGPGHPLITWQGYEVKPKPGLLILFPSYIPHSVGYNKDNKRLILSGNIEVI